MTSALNSQHLPGIPVPILNEKTLILLPYRNIFTKKGDLEANEVS